MYVQGTAMNVVNNREKQNGKRSINGYIVKYNVARVFERKIRV